jgi:ABC-type antimicrobial peptide transport system permease subunit
VAVVNEAFVRLILQDGRAIGRQIRFGPGAPVTIVGVVETGKYQTLTETATPAIFQPMLQAPNTTTMILVRSTRPDAEIAEAMRRAVHEADPALPLMSVRSVEDMLGFVRLPMQAAALALGAFGILAATLAATGIHGVVAYAVSRRRRELAIRVALGAPRRSLVQLVLRRTFFLVTTGAVVGVALVFALSPVLASVLYVRMSASVWSWVLVAGLITLVSAVACAWPTWRALRLDPVSELAAE